VANYANTYSIKLDKSDFDSKLTSLASAYKSATTAMETQSIDLKRAKQDLATVEKLKNAELKKGIQTSTEVNKQFKEELAFAKSSVAYQTQKNNAHKQNISNIKSQIANLKTLSHSENEVQMATRESLNQQKRSTIALKDKVGITTKAEIVTRKYADLMRQVAIAEKRGTLTTKEATLARKQLNIQRKAGLITAKESIAYRNTAINGVVRHIRKIESLVIAFYALKKSYDYTLGLGHEFNKMIESEQIGIALSITQKLKDVDATGKQVSAMDKWIYANKLAREEMEKVREINVFTPHTLGQTVQLYKTISVQVREAKGNVQDALDITKQLSILSKAGNVEFKSMLKTVDQLFSGKMKASDMQIALQNIVGLTQEETREAIKQGKVLEYVKEKLMGVEIASANVAKTWEGVTSNFENAWTDIFATLQKPMFESLKEEMRDFTIVLIDNKDDIIGTFEDLGKGVKFVYNSLDELVLAYVAFTTLAKGKAIHDASKAMAVYSIATRSASISTTALAVSTGVLAKVFTPINMAVIALVGTYVLYNATIGETADEEASVAKAMRLTEKAIKDLSDTRLKASKIGLRQGLLNTQREINKVVDELNAKDLVSILLNRKKSNISKKDKILLEAKLEVLTKERAERQKQLNLIHEQLTVNKENKNHIDFATDAMEYFTEETYKALKASNELSSSLSKVALAFGKAMTTSRLISGEITSDVKKVTDAQVDLQSAKEKQIASEKEILRLSEQKAEGKDVDKLKKALIAETKTLQQSYVDVQNKENTLRSLGNELSAKGIDTQKKSLILSAKELEISNRLNKDKHASDKYSLKVAKIEHEFTLKRIQTNKEGLSVDEQKQAINSANLTLKEAELDYKDAILKTDTKSGKQADKLLKTTNKLYDKYLELTGQKNLLEAFKIDKTVEEFRKAGYEASKLLEIRKALEEKDDRAFDKEFALEAPTIVEEVFNPYLNLIESQKEYAKNIEEAGDDQYKINKINAKQVELQLKGYAGLANGLKGMFKEGTKGYKAMDVAQKILQVSELAWFVKQQIMESTSISTKLANTATDTASTIASESAKSTVLGVNAVLTQGQGDPYTAWARMSAMVALVAGLGVAISGVGGSTVSQADIDNAKGRSDYDDSSLKDVVGGFEEAQYPMLEVTNKMYKHLRNMDGNFYSIARAMNAQASAGGVDLTGVNFVDTMSEGFLGFSSTTTSLISSGLSFELQALSDLMSEATLNARAYTTTLVEESSWWGLSSSTTIQKSFSDLPPSVISELASSFADGYEAILLAGTTLGIDEVKLKADLLASELDLGEIDFTGLSPDEVNTRLSDAFGTAFSGIIEGIGEFDVLVEKFAKSTEYSLETLIRIATEYDQASHMFSLIGKDFTDGIIEVTRTWSETTDISSDFWSGIFDRTKELTTWYTETTQELYTSQMQMLDIVASTGGLTEFQDAMGSFMGSFYTEAEQLDFLTKSMTISFETLGVEMPKTNDEFRNLLETMDTSTEEGAYLYGQILLLAESFATMTEASESLGTSMKDMFNDVADAWLGNLSYLTLKQKAEYASGLMALARESEEEFDIVEIAKLQAETSMATSRTKEEYMPDFEYYIHTMEAQVAKATLDDVVFELQEGFRDLAESIRELEFTERKVV